MNTKKRYGTQVSVAIGIFACCTLHPIRANAADPCPPAIEPPQILIDARETQLAGGLPMKFDDLLKDQDAARETQCRYVDYYSVLNDGQGGLKPQFRLYKKCTSTLGRGTLC
jgi:hypothetical protein